MSAVRTVIGVPGRWANQSDIVASIAQHSGGYLFAGMAMIKIGTKEGFGVEVYDHDPDMKQAFANASGGRFSKELLKAIDSHTNTLYLSGDGGSVEAATKLMHAANALLKSGGIAIKIESSGTAHRADQWEEFCSQVHLGSQLPAFVACVEGDERDYYSCGMHNLGFPDAIVSCDEPASATKLLNAFNSYMYFETPVLKDGETFSISSEAPAYRLRREPCKTFEPDDLFHNPFGMWRLTLT